MYKKYSLLWLFLPVLAILNGTARQFLYAGFTGQFLAHQISSLILIILIFEATRLFNIRWKLESSKQALIIGTIWLFMTLIFEFGFGHYLARKTLEQLFQEYNILEGRLWLLVLLFTFLSPYIVYKSSLLQKTSSK
ncbi:MAG: hypothetical protein NTX22_16820 [Ignavibacteriales bacterium]|nr:hypothetical protein [Ignavibacteriales bacterium]